MKADKSITYGKQDGKQESKPGKPGKPRGAKGKPVSQPALATKVIQTHPLADRLPLGPLHPPPPGLASQAQTIPTSPASRSRPATVASKLISTRTAEVTLIEINSCFPASDERPSTIAIRCSSDFLWLVKQAAVKRKIDMGRLVIGCLLQALTEDPPPAPTPDPEQAQAQASDAATEIGA